ncbi:MAG: hypothetical protein AB7O92_07230 [Acidimicrobiia bacterium]
MKGAARATPLWRWSRVAALVLVTIVAVLIGTAAPAGADPARPTDYAASVTGIEPPAGGLEVSIIGGDAFIELVNRTGTEVTVPGYEGEPYLRFAVGGTVEENQLSPSVVLNRNRYPSGSDAEAEALARTDVDADPAWKVVARDGRYRWHDHRTHWMSPQPPLGREPGDVILDGVLPMRVGDVDTSVAVQVRWVASPSAFPSLLGGTVVAALLVAAVLVAARRGPTAALAMAAGAVALTALAAATISARERSLLPAEVGPSPVRLVLAVVAAVVAVAAVLPVPARVAPASWRAGLGLLAALELVAWAWLRRAGLSKPVLPIGESWAGADRLAVAAALVVATAAALLFGTELFRTPRAIPAAPANGSEAPPAGSD